MGHNVVVSKLSDMSGVLRDGMKAGLAQDYVKAGDSRVLAKTRLLSGGESASLTFKVAKLQDGAYGFVCTFPGHGAMMRGTIVLK
jgi:azurin